MTDKKQQFFQQYILTRQTYQYVTHCSNKPTEASSEECGKLVLKKNKSLLHLPVRACFPVNFNGNNGFDITEDFDYFPQQDDNRCLLLLAERCFTPAGKAVWTQMLI